MDIEVAVNRVYLPYLENDSRYEVIYGGAGSGKSYFVAQKKVLQHIQAPGRRTLVTRKVGKTIRHSCFAQIREAAHDMGLQNFFYIPRSKTHFDIRCHNGNEIIFAALDDVEKLKSIVGITDIWAEEANEMTEDDFKQLDLRLRGPTRHSKQITLTFNPVSALSWIKPYFFDRAMPDASILKTTYQDNLFIDNEYKQMLERLRDQDHTYYQIYALGEWGVLGNLIYSNYTVEEIPLDPDYYGSIYQGMDFGFNNPSAYLKIGLKDDEIYVLWELYVRGLTNNEWIREVDEVADRNIMVTADSAEPDRIKEFRQAGYLIRGARKGPGSVKAGIDWCKRRKIRIHPQCENFIKEIQGYKYREDADGNVYDEPVDWQNHLMDAFRYALQDNMRHNIGPVMVNTA